MTTGVTINLRADGGLERREHPLLPPRRGGALLAIERANVCGSDVHLWRGGHPTLHDCVLGHEFAGRIVDTAGTKLHDARGEPLTEGDRLVCSYFRVCGTCEMCRLGRTNLCEVAYASWGRSSLEQPYFRGAFASHYQLHPEQFTVKVPDALPSSLAALANCALAQGLAVVDRIRADVLAGPCLVIGAGALGLSAVAGAPEGTSWDVYDRVPARRANAELFPGARALGELPPAGGTLDGHYDLVVVAAGTPEAFATALEQVRPGGQIVMMGIINTRETDAVSIRPGVLTRKGITVSSAIRYTVRHLAAAVDLLCGDTPLRRLPLAEFGLDAVADALTAAERCVSGRVSLVPDGGPR
ncbi:zinc-binding alcohol dehydrogenase [Streptomyces hygroscopicus subsp. hygroscopicus]|nr:alcohol dehydrogenase catalytic domain-containing protein [Streptomyces hygroscopicus]GLX47537.1 zinc-binding alcohol dehydrogenase [Streptomyces hygroscopicus subsp. hygroscopicus]